MNAANIHELCHSQSGPPKRPRGGGRKRGVGNGKSSGGAGARHGTLPTATGGLRRSLDPKWLPCNPTTPPPLTLFLALQRQKPQFTLNSYFCLWCAPTHGSKLCTRPTLQENSPALLDRSRCLVGSVFIQFLNVGKRRTPRMSPIYSLHMWEKLYT